MNKEDQLKVGRSVRVTSGKHAGIPGLITEWDSLSDRWTVDVGYTYLLLESGDIDPLFSMDQVLVNVEEDAQPALVKKVIPFGMSSDDLAHEAAEFISECVGRIKGVGNDQYDSGGHQKFEELELDELFQCALEELQDIANYTVFLGIRIQRIRAALEERDDLGKGTDEEYEAGDITADHFKEE